MELTEATVSQHYYWTNLRNNMRTHIKVCNTCHKNKKQNLKYGKLPAKEAEAIPLEILSVYLIRPYTIRREGHEYPLTLKAVTMIEPETEWIVIVLNLVEQTWLCRYPHPTTIKYERVNELLGHTFKNHIIKTEYGNKAKCNTTANPQANSLLERIYQFIANLVRNFDLQNNYLEKDEPRSGILAATAFAL